MSVNGNNSCKYFEQEALLFIGNELPDAKMVFWRRHLLVCSICSELINEYENIIESSKKNLSYDIDDSIYERMIEKALCKKKMLKLRNVFSEWEKKEKLVHTGKIVFASALVIITIIVSMNSEKPNAVKSVSKELLDWDGDVITSQLNDIRNRINIIKTTNMDHWNMEFNSINKTIDLLEKQADPKSFY